MRKEIYSPQLLQEIKTRIDLTSLIRKYTALNGKNKGICPFHDDHTPSLSVNPDKNIWRCFGCNKGGDCFSFIMEAEQLTFKNAVRLLALEAGVKLSELGTIKEENGK